MLSNHSYHFAGALRATLYVKVVVFLKKPSFLRFDQFDSVMEKFDALHINTKRLNILVLLLK
jgi:hypothetical protein